MTSWFSRSLFVLIVIVACCSLCAAPDAAAQSRVAGTYVNLAAPPHPLPGYVNVIRHVTGGSRVYVELRGDDLYVAGRKVTLAFLEGKYDCFSYDNLVSATSRMTLLNANLQYALLSTPSLIPTSWREGNVVFLGTAYLMPNGKRCVRDMAYTEAGGWEGGFMCDDRNAPETSEGDCPDWAPWNRYFDGIIALE